MRHFTRRRPFVATAGLLVALAACSDAGSISAPEDAGLGQAAAAPGNATPTSKPSTSATSIDLGVTVGAAVAGKDSLAYTPLANAKVTVYSRKLVAAPGGGADSLMVSESVVANATTDASGKARFAGLPAAEYRVEAVRTGNGGGTASLNLAPPYAADVGVLLIIRP
jgi:hypothetical protein